MKRLVIIDGKSVFYRGYYAMGALSLSDGTPTGGVYGFAAIAMEIVERLNPTKVVVAWDSRDSAARRREIFADYKAGRVKPGEDFYAQIPLLEKLINDLGWTFIEVSKYEADDIIGTLSRQADEEMNKNGECEWETYIISSDLDMLQIVDENTHMWRIMKGFSNIQQIDVKEIEEKYGIKKSQFLDLKALKGDASDNIPGVPGVGEKTAAKLLNEYDSLDGIYEHIDEIKGSVQKKLIEGKKSAYMSQKLAKIMFDAPVSLTQVPEFEFAPERVRFGLEKLEFYSLIRKFNLEKNDNKGKEEIKKYNIEISKDTILDWNVKQLMHDDKKQAEEILNGKEFWDLGQAEFLLNPLERKQMDHYDPMDLKTAYKVQRQEMEKLPKLYKVYKEFDLPLIPILYKMEKKGMLIDREYFEKLKVEYAKEVERLEREIWDLAGKEFNVNSPVQLSEVLFVELELPVKGIKKTTRGYSTGAKELAKLKELHPIVPKLIEYREAAKLLSTYIIPMPELADDEDRIHTTFTQNVTATGRLSSKDPNLQNIPVRTEAGKRIRTGFVAPESKVLVSADYSQFELRLAAVLAGDEALINDFNKGIDIHTKTAAEAFNVPIDKVTKAQRRAAKVINFGILYGMSVKGLADAAKMPIGQAKEFIDNYFRLRAPIKEYLETILTQAREKGYVETYYGRRRPTPDVKSSNFIIRQAAERAAQNMPIQGTEADLMKRAMIRVDASLPAGAELVMQVHDSLIVECDAKLADKVKKVLQSEMETVAPELKIKLALDITVGKNWGEL
ncbi:hypothetical protein IKF20_01180 [Candidatus Saccharibacteria bacterium]|nr:hypothetical protein [Candidatus Saccharibacteria bacterium]MBR3157032.1 hypothetical protein [Candidatus Saccharibacteria bacterium]